MHSLSKDRAGQWIGNQPGDRGIMLVSNVEGCDEVIVVVEHRLGQKPDPFWTNALEISIHQDYNTRLEQFTDFKYCAQR